MKIQEAFREIINPEVVLDIVTGEGKIIYKENHKDSKIKKLHIMDVPENAFAFTLDYDEASKNRACFKQLSIYLDKSVDIVNKSCDLILILPNTENKHQILIFDLKSDKPNLNDTEKQLLNSELYIHYLLSMLQHHYDIEIKNIMIKQAIVHTGQLKKRLTYSPNHSKQLYEYPFRIESVAPKKGEASIHLKALLK